MRGVTFFGFLFALLPLAALGHDGYIAYKHPELGPPLEAFRFSDLGWLWVTYSRDTFDMAKNEIPAVTWSSFIDPVLSQPSILVAATPLILLMICTLIHNIFQKIKIMRVGGGKADGGFAYRESKKPGGQVKYKRR